MSGWALAARIAARELRSGLTGFRVFLASVVIGVAAIAAVGTMGAAMVGGLRADARALLGGDVDVMERHRPPDPERMAALRDSSRRLSEITEMRAMARAEGGETRALVELKAVDDAYPLVGALDLDPARTTAEALGRRDGIWGAVAEAGVMDRLGLPLGARVRIGEELFELRARVAREPDRVAGLFSLGPRVMIAAAALPGTGLIQPGSQTSHHVRVLLPENITEAEWTARLTRAFPDAAWRMRGLDDAAPGARRFIERMGMFLSFAGLTALLVGGIGVAGAVRGYLDGRMRTIAILKCLGAPRGLVFRTYLLQVGALGALAIAAGLALGAALPPLALAAVADRLPVAPAPGPYPLELLRAAGFGALTVAAFSLGPLALAAKVPASQLFRKVISPLRGRVGRWALAGVLGCAAGLSGLTLVSVERPLFALWFVLGTLAALATLRGGAWALTRLAAAIGPGRRSAAWRMALANLHRPGAPTAGIVVSIGLGAAVLTAVALVEGNLNRQIAGRLPDEAPALFLLDIQPHQLDGLRAEVAGVAGAAGFEERPMLRGRITAIAGRPADQVAVAYDAEWAVRGDRGLTFAAAMPPGTELVAGAWWPADYRGPPLISLDASVARGFGIGVGDTLTLNVLGREITATVASLREIDWRSLRFDFAIIFAPGVLEGAPRTHVAALRAPPGADAEVERRVTDRFPNVSSVRVRAALETAARVVAGVAAAIRASAAVTLAAGVLVVAGAIAAGRERRLREAVIFKVLGATRRDVLAAQLAEHAALGAVAGLVALVVGTAASYALVRHVMGFAWAFQPVPALATTLACVALATLLGLAETARVLGRKAAPHLREE